MPPKFPKSNFWEILGIYWEVPQNVSRTEPSSEKAVSVIVNVCRDTEGPVCWCPRQRRRSIMCMPPEECEEVRFDINTVGQIYKQAKYLYTLVRECISDIPDLSRWRLHDEPNVTPPRSPLLFFLSVPLTTLRCFLLSLGIFVSFLCYFAPLCVCFLAGLASLPVPPPAHRSSAFDLVEASSSKACGKYASFTFFF